MIVLGFVADHTRGASSDTGPATKPRKAGEARADDRPEPEFGPAFVIERFEVKYALGAMASHPATPGAEALEKLKVELGWRESGFVAPGEDIPSVEVQLSEAWTGLGKTYRASAIRTVAKRIVRHLKAQGLMGVFVQPSSQDMLLREDGSARDQRPEGRTALELVVWVGLVEDVRTTASGERFDEKVVNHPEHAWIRRESPVQPAGGEGNKEAATADAEGGVAGATTAPAGGSTASNSKPSDVLRKDEIDRYVFNLNRHSARRVDVAVGPGEEQGGVVLDYRVRESRPWYVYGQLENTGTEDTDEWRQVLGFAHNQLTGNDDSLSIQYTTTALDEVNAVSGSYEAPLFDPIRQRLRWRVFGSWSEFTASEVGAAGQEFVGEDWSAGGEIIANVLQDDNLFVDLVTGARWQDSRVEQPSPNAPGQELTAETSFFVPKAGLRLERETRAANTRARAMVEWNIADMAGTEADELAGLGRLGANPSFEVLRFGFNQSLFLEPLFTPAQWNQGASPDENEKVPSLAHEIGVRIEGQYSFDDRLVPQETQTVGGLRRVRGYEESIASGDTAVMAGVEYRYHLPRGLPIQPDPAATPLFGDPFRVAPQRAYGTTDWDLILRGFLDAGWTDRVDRRPTFEVNQALLGAGVGLEFRFKENIRARADWGFALNELEDAAGRVIAEEGTSEVHLSFTVLY